jgi:hypothetical protein
MRGGRHPDPPSTSFGGRGALLTRIGAGAIGGEADGPFAAAEVIAPVLSYVPDRTGAAPAFSRPVLRMIPSALASASSSSAIC